MATVRHTTSPEAARLVALAEGLEGMSCKVGWFPSAQYKNGVPAAYVAAIQEFGYASGGIPPRPFIRPTIEAQQDAWKDVIVRGARSVLKGSNTPVHIFDMVGSLAAGDIQRAIAELTTPALAPSTLAGRRRHGNANTKPLVDTRYMYNTLTYITEGGAA